MTTTPPTPPPTPASAPLPPSSVADAIGSLSAGIPQSAAVELSNELVGLLSSQLYRTPLKAIEELVVNSYDADARKCVLAVPSPATISKDPKAFIALWDDGAGMDVGGLITLWNIGASPKRDASYAKRFSRKQIGKFGIGKLATYTIASRVTYISKTAAAINAVTIDYGLFSSGPSGKSTPVPVTVVPIVQWSTFVSSPRIAEVTTALGVSAADLNGKHWTLVVLEELKPKSQEIRLGRLEWVLRTAMPVDPAFSLVLNGNEIASAKDSLKAIVSFAVDELPAERLVNLGKATGEKWEIKDKRLVCATLPAGIRGDVRVFDRSLRGGKSDDIARSHGFFIRVRDRLLNEDDALFGLDELSFTTFYAFRAELSADDLDAAVLASREEVENSSQRRMVEFALKEIFNEARQRHQAFLESLFRKEKTGREEDREFVAPRLVERPIADVLASEASRTTGADADKHWFYLRTNNGIDVRSLLERLYSDQRERFHYRYETRGRNDRLVELDPASSTFTLNDSHDFVIAHRDEPASRRLLHDFVTAEVMLEVYLREAEISPLLVGEVLERRDSLMRGLAKDHMVSPAAIAAALKDAAADEHDLEVAVIRAIRALGFNAKHISGAGEPDGVARLITHPDGEVRITVEAKSSGKVPSLGSLDFAGLAEHVLRTNAQGCLLVAPAYPAAEKADDAAAAVRARMNKVSCWTIEQLAMVVERSEARFITAKQVWDVVRTSFTPDEVQAAVSALLSSPGWSQTELCREILATLRRLQNRVKDRPRSIDMIAGSVSQRPEFELVTATQVREAIVQMAGASRQGLTLGSIDRDSVVLTVSLDELEIRLAGLIGGKPLARARGGFLADSASADESTITGSGTIEWPGKDRPAKE